MKSVAQPGWHRLFYTRAGELDFGWLILATCCVVGVVGFVLAGFGVFKAPGAAWGWFGAFTSMAFIAGAAVDRARLIAQSRTPGEVAQAIASALPDDPRLPSRFDDERGEAPSI